MVSVNKQRKNRRGQMVVVSAMVAFLLFIVAVVLIEPIKEVASIGRDTDHLDCDNDDLTTGENMACIINDMFLPVFLWTCFGVAIAYFGVKDYRSQG